MRLFSRPPSWERTFRLRSQIGFGRGLLSFFFWAWGLIGFLFNAGSLLGLTGSVEVGTSAYLTATSLIWIGGMVLFGIGALLSHNDFEGERPAPGDGDIRISR